MTPSLLSIARAVSAVGPIGAYSRRPMLMTILVAAATFGLLPASPAARVIVVLIAVALADVSARIVLDADAGAGTREGEGSVPAGSRPSGSTPCVADRWAGMWVALLPVPDGFTPLVLTTAAYLLLAVRPVWPVSRVAEWQGGRARVADDVLAGLLAGALVTASARLVG